MEREHGDVGGAVFQGHGEGRWAGGLRVAAHVDRGRRRGDAASGLQVTQAFLRFGSIHYNRYRRRRTVAVGVVDSAAGPGGTKVYRAWPWSSAAASL